MADPEHNETIAELRQEAQRAEAASAQVVVARPVRRYRARLFQAYLVAATVGFAVLFFYARHVAYFRFDLAVARWVQHWRALWLDVLMQVVSALGYSPLAGVFVGLTILFVYLVGLKWEAVMLMFAALGVWLLDVTMKLLVGRHRPTPDLVNVFSPLSDSSFPSGHVLLFTVFLTFLAFLIYTLMRRSWVRTLGLSVLGVLIALVGVSRVYLGHHWPSDVIGAYLLGSLWVTLTIYLYRKGKNRWFVKQPLAGEKTEE